MAAANQSSPCQDLTKCSICKETINKPKALQCLHTFCFECLVEWSKRDKAIIRCPVVSCKKTTPMPSDGVISLPGNVFVASLIENSPKRNKNIPCVCCDETGNEVIGNCMNCPGFLCQEGVEMHKKPLLRAHHVIRLEDVKSGKIDLKKLSEKKKPTCSKHEGQALWFFCETCQVLICRDCTVVMHQKPEHKYVELQSVVEEQKKKLEELVKGNEVLKEEVETEIQKANTARSVVRAHMQKVNTEIDQTAEQIKKHVDAVCRAEKDRLRKEQRAIEDEYNADIASAEEHLTDQMESLQTAINMANQVLQTGSDYDVASVYQQVSSALENNRQVKPNALSPDVTNLPKLVSHLDMTINNVTSLGEFQVSFTSCILEGRFGQKDAEKGPGKLDSVRGIATTSNGDIAITSSYEKAWFPVRIYSISGKFKFSLDKQSSAAWDVATMSDGRFFVTRNSAKDGHVMVFSSCGQYQSRFPTVSPAGVSSDKEDKPLRGIAVNNATGKVIVGEINKKYISIHNADGTHCNSFPLTIAPYFLVVTRRQGHTVVSPWTPTQGVQIVDSSGSVLHTINAPQGVSSWYPGGVCCSSNDDVFVFNRGSPVGIYRFSSSGSYLGCINNDNCYTHYYEGLTFSLDEQRLLVADGSNVVYSFKRN